MLPDAPLTITGPGEESGTFDSYVELVITPIATTRETGPDTTRPDYTASANDNTIIEGIAASDTSLGWVGFAFAEENSDKVTEIQVSKDPNGTCVAPTAETIADGSYPLSRSLYIYVNKAKAAANPAGSLLRRLLPGRGHHLQRPQGGPLREPAGVGARRHAGGLGSREVAPLSHGTGRACSEARPVRSRILASVRPTTQER